MGQPTPVWREEGEPFLFVDAEVTLGRSTRLDLPLPSAGGALHDYTSRYAPKRLLEHRLRARDVSVLEALSRALALVSSSDARDVGTYYGRALRPFVRDLELGPAIAAWLERCFADEALPRALRGALAEALATDFFPTPALDALFASGLVDPSIRATYETYRARTVSDDAAGERELPFEARVDPELLADPSRAVREVRDGGRAVLAARPDARSDVLAALQLAITDETEPLYVRYDALRQLAAIDRAHAIGVARLVRDPLLSFATAPLLALPEPGALARYAHEVGLIAELSSSALAAATLADVLEPHVYRFDRETDVYPNGYDRLLTSLAELVSPVLDDVLFEEVPHLELDLDEDGEHGDPEQLADAYRLRALLPDRSYEIVAGDTGDWIIVEPVLGFVNTLCQARDSQLRFVEIPTGSQQAAVLAAPAPAIRRALADGLLVLVQPADADA